MTGAAPRIREAGDAALVLELDAVIDADVNAQAIAIAQAVRGAQIPGVRDVVSTYRSVAVFFDPLTTDPARVTSVLRAPQAAAERLASRTIDVPVIYGGEDGPDLEAVAAWAGLSPQAVIERHAVTPYRVFMLGFLPGFAYLGRVDPTIAAPRRAEPRLRVPAGSVGIAGHQTAVYPRMSPGGWSLIGRTTATVFDPGRTPASLFEPGDTVRFVPSKSGAADVTVRPSDMAPAPVAAAGSGRHITVVRPGLFTTVQDLGRWGQQSFGVPVAGAMDAVSHRLANRLAGNADDAAALEATLLGPEIRLEAETTVAVAGADLGATLDGTPLPAGRARRCPAGTTLRFGARGEGTRATIAFDGGVATAPLLGSRATHVVSGLGRALRAGDWLPLGSARVAPPLNGAPTVAPAPAGGARLRVMPGPQDDFFAAPAMAALQQTRFTISPQSDRMGYRLSGTTRVARVPDCEMISDVAVIGGIQVPPSGDPILLMADRQTTGGYPQIACVITADLPLAGQLAPGDWIEFQLCTRAEAIEALMAQEASLHAGT